MTQTVIPAGLGETFGLSAEATVGTYVAPARWIPHKKATLVYKKTTAQSEALRGSRFLAGPRRVLVAHTVDGTIELELQDKQFGLILAKCLGSTAAPIVNGATTLFTQTHVPGFLEGQSLSIQKGIPMTNGTPQAFSYNGVKITDWTIACARGGIATLSLTVDGWDEATATALTAPTYLSGASVPNLLNWSSGTLLAGGTVTTTSGITTVSAGAAPVGLISSFSVKGTNVLDQARFQLGSMIKAEQLTNGFSHITGDLEIEFANLADFYTVFKADTPTALQISLTSPVVQTGITAGLYITVPSVRFEGETPAASGPSVIRVKVPFTALEDQLGNPTIQLAYTSLDTAL